jgi:hypothetical protein
VEEPIQSEGGRPMGERERAHIHVQLHTGQTLDR